MAKVNKLITVNTVVFLGSSLFCSVWNNELYEDEEAIARYLKVPEKDLPSFCVGLSSAWNGLFLSMSERKKKFTRIEMAKSFSKAPIFGDVINKLGIKPDQVVQAKETTSIFEYNKLENYSEVSNTLEYLYKKGYNLILRDDKPESILKEAMKQMGFLKYFNSIQGMYDRYRTFTVNSMKEIIGEKDPKEVVLVTGCCPKLTIRVAKQMGIPTVSTIAELKTRL